MKIVNVLSAAVVLIQAAHTLPLITQKGVSADVSLQRRVLALDIDASAPFAGSVLNKRDPAEGVIGIMLSKSSKSFKNTVDAMFDRKIDRSISLPAGSFETAPAAPPRLTEWYLPSAMHSRLKSDRVRDWIPDANLPPVRDEVSTEVKDFVRDRVATWKKPGANASLRVESPELKQLVLTRLHSYKKLPDIKQPYHSFSVPAKADFSESSKSSAKPGSASPGHGSERKTLQGLFKGSP